MILSPRSPGPGLSAAMGMSADLGRRPRTPAIRRRSLRGATALPLDWTQGGRQTRSDSVTSTLSSRATRALSHWHFSIPVHGKTDLLPAQTVRCLHSWAAGDWGITVMPRIRTPSCMTDTVWPYQLQFRVIPLAGDSGPPGIDTSSDFIYTIAIDTDIKDTYG
jgi:hypothetical protein